MGTLTHLPAGQQGHSRSRHPARGCARLQPQPLGPKIKTGTPFSTLYPRRRRGKQPPTCASEARRVRGGHGGAGGAAAPAPPALPMNEAGGGERCSHRSRPSQTPCKASCRAGAGLDTRPQPPQGLSPWCNALGRAAPQTPSSSRLPAGAQRRLVGEPSPASPPRGPPSSAPGGHFYTSPSPAPRWDPTSPMQSPAPPPPKPCSTRAEASTLIAPPAGRRSARERGASTATVLPGSFPARSIRAWAPPAAGRLNREKKKNLLFPPKNTRSQGEDSPPLLTAPSHQPNGLQKRGGGGGGS